jgi:predicted Zn-dependent peptidase
VKNHVHQCLGHGIDERDFLREKKCLYASYISDFDSTEDIAFAMSSAASDKTEIFAYTDIVDSIDIDYVTELANKIFKEESITLSVIRP